MGARCSLSFLVAFLCLALGYPNEEMEFWDDIYDEIFHNVYPGTWFVCHVLQSFVKSEYQEQVSNPTTQCIRTT